MDLTKLKFVIILLCSFWLSGCKNPDNTNEIIVEPVGGSYYYVKNQTEFDLLVQFPVPVYDRSIDSIILVDSTIQIPRLATTKIFEDIGNFGFNPTPSHTFKEIKFHTINGEQKELILSIKPVIDDQWIANILHRDQYGYGLTEYQFVLKKEDL